MLKLNNSVVNSDKKSKCSIDGGKIIGKPVTARFSKIRFDFFNPIQGYPVGGNNSLGSRMLLNLWLLRVQQKTPTDRVRVQSGAGGSRTRVQTLGPYTFYMLIPAWFSWAISRRAT